MLDFIRQRAQGWIAWTIVILIIIPFALWGVNEYFGGGRAAPAAEVDGEPISQDELQRAYYQERQRLQEMLGANFKPDLFPEEQIKAQVLQRLVRQRLLIQAALESGLRVSDLHLAQTIRDVEAFQKDGEFDQELYERLLAQQGMQPAFFEAQVRRDLITGQLYRGYVATGFVTERQVDDLLRLQNQTRHIGYLTLPAKRFENEVTVSEQAIADYYEQYADRFVVPERVKVAYLDLDMEQLAESVEVNEATLRTRYEARKENYRTPEQRRARHILIASEDGDDAAAEKEANELLKQLEAGADFDALAKAHSDDPGSAQQGGDLGLFGRGAMVPAFEEAVFAMAEGEVRGPVKTPFGYHIIRLDEVRESQVRSFDEVRSRLEQDFRREQAEERFYDLAERLANLTYEQPDTLTVAAEQLGLEIKEAGPFPRGGASEGIAAHPAVAAAAFSEDVLTGGHNSETLEIGSNRLIVLRVLEHYPETRKALEEVREEIRASLHREQMIARAKEEAEALAEKIRGGEKPAEVAAAAKLSWEEVPALARGDSEPGPEVVRAAFRLARPDASGPSADTVSLPSGEQVVVALFGVQEGRTEVDAAEREQVREFLRQANGEAAFAGLLQALQSRAEISVK